MSHNPRLTVKTQGITKHYLHYDQVGSLSYIGGRIGNIEKNIKNYSETIPTITNIKYSSINWGGSIGNYGNTGAAIGAVVGRSISDSGEGYL